MAGVIVLERQGQVSRIRNIRNEKNGLQQELLFKVPLPALAHAVTASAEAVYVSAGVKSDCRIFRYALGSGTVSEKIASPGDTCAGIAAAGGSVLVVFPGLRQIRSWDTWESATPRILALEPMRSPSFLVFDRPGQRLLVSDSALAPPAPVYGTSVNAPMPIPNATPGAEIVQRPFISASTDKIYAVSVVNGSMTLVVPESTLPIRSIAANANHILMTAGNKIALAARADGHSEESPPALQSLPGGEISGIACDVSGNVWYSAIDKGTVVGPLVIP